MDRDKLAKLLTSAMERHATWEQDGGLWTLTTDTDIKLGPWSIVDGWPTTEGIHDEAGLTGTLTCRRFQIALDADGTEGIEWPANILSEPTTTLELSSDDYARVMEFMGKPANGTPHDGMSVITFRSTLGISRPADDGERDIYTATLFDLLAFLAAQDARNAGRADDEAALMAAIPFVNGIPDEPITDAQAAEILARIGEDRPMIVKSGKRYTEAMGADSRHRMWKLKETDIFVTRAGGDDSLTIFNTNKNKIVANAGTGKLLSHLNAVIQERGLECGPDEVLRVSTSYADILSVCGLSDTKGNRSRIRKNLQALSETAFKWSNANGEQHVNVCADYLVRRNGSIEFAFTPKFVAAFMGHNAGLLAVDRLLMTTDDQAHPHAFAIGHRLTTHACINADKPNRYRLSVGRLLAHVKSIPSHGDVKDRAYTRRIIEPLERDLDYLEAIGFLDYWDYCHANGETLTDAEQAARLDDKGEAAPLPYEIAKDCLIEWRPVHPYDGHAQALTDARARNRQARARAKGIGKAAK